MAYIRQEIRGTTPQDIMKINENTMGIYEKVFGDINFSDTDKDMQSKIMTQWLPIQGEGNLDASYPLLIRFFVPPNVKEVKSSSFNMICENFRMDSTVTQGGGSYQTGNVNLSVASGGGYTETLSESSKTSIVKKWGWLGSQVPAEYEPPYYSLVYGDAGANGLNWKYGGYYTTPNYDGLVLGAGVEKYKDNNSGQDQYVLDLLKIQHQHEIPAHSHNIAISPHTHSGTVGMTIPDHEHNLKAGIFVSTDTPQNVFVQLNDQAVAELTSAPLNNQDWTSFIKIGQWNTIKITTTNLARVVLYGTVELVIKNS